MKASFGYSLMAVLALSNAMARVQPRHSNDNDDFWAEKPMHTTDLMAGKASVTVKHSTTHTQSPTAATKIPTLDVDIDEL